MLVRIIFILTIFCGILKSYDGVHEDFLLSKEDEEKYADLLSDSDNRELIKTLFEQIVPSHNRLSPESVARLKIFREKIRNRSDLIVEILKRERVDFRSEMSSEDHASILRSIMVLNFVRHKQVSDPEKIVEEVRLRLLPWSDFEFRHRNDHTYLHPHFEILLSYGDFSDLERIGLFKDHPNGVTRSSAENVYSRLEKRLNEESNKKELAGNFNNSKSLWWWVFGILLAGAGGIWFYKRRA